MRWRHLNFWRRVPAGQPRLQGTTIKLMVCSSDRTLGLLNLAVGAYLNGFFGTHLQLKIRLPLKSKVGAMDAEPSGVPTAYYTPGEPGCIWSSFDRGSWTGFVVCFGGDEPCGGRLFWGTNSRPAAHGRQGSASIHARPV